jgi:N-acetylglucosamine-6-sulfatase
MQGRSLMPLLTGDRREWRKSFLIEYYSDKVFPRITHMGYQAVRTRQWKYIHYLELKGMDELYDLKNDPFEMKNLIHQSGAGKARAEMLAEMGRLIKETNGGSR